MDPNDNIKTLCIANPNTYNKTAGCVKKPRFRRRGMLYLYSVLRSWCNLRCQLIVHLPAAGNLYQRMELASMRTLSLHKALREGLSKQQSRPLAVRTNRPSSQAAFRRRIRPSSQAVFPRSSDRLLIQVWYLRKTLLGPHQRLQSVSFHNSVTVSFAIPIHDTHLQTFEIPVIC